jgi:zinc and cadmium transporter
LDRGGTVVVTLFWVLAGFIVFFALEQFVHWHHCHRAANSCKQPLTYLILVGDGLHNFLGGLAVASTFLVDIRLGIATWLAAAAHEVPQELGDFAVLVHGGWTARNALLFNVLSALTFLVGGLVTYFAAARIDVSFLLPFAAGNFLYIGASDLVPEVNKHDSFAVNAVHFAAFVTGTFTIVAVGRLLQ